MSSEPTCSVQLSASDIDRLLAAIEFQLANDPSLAPESRDSLDYLGQHLDRAYVEE
jgi:hypothetical protein